jgi:cyclic-di-GMP-binding protein
LDIFCPDAREILASRQNQAAGGRFHPRGKGASGHSGSQKERHLLVFNFPFFIYLWPMPSFDIVSEVSSMEIENAVNQAKKELATRFDFKGSKAEITLEKNEIKLSAEDQFKIQSLHEIMIGKLAKRQVSLKSVESSTPDISPLGHARQVIKIKQGLEQPVAKQIAGFIRETKLKITTQIQGDAVRVSGKNKDDLQAVIAAVRAHDFPAALTFQNFRD